MHSLPTPSTPAKESGSWSLVHRQEVREREKEVERVGRDLLEMGKWMDGLWTVIYDFEVAFSRNLFLMVPPVSLELMVVANDPDLSQMPFVRLGSGVSWTDPDFDCEACDIIITSTEDRGRTCWVSSCLFWFEGESGCSEVCLDFAEFCSASKASDTCDLFICSHSDNEAKG